MEKPKHSKASFWGHQKLFHDISNFDQLESRISSLPTNKEKGDAFEIFAEAYLVTQPLIQAEIVWPFNSIPLQIKERFGLHTGNDMGVDGIFKTNLNEFNAYQAKFRSGRPSLNWGELSTFMGLTDQVNQRVLFTNCDELPPVINNRTGFYCIRGSDLDKLEKRDFENIIGWLENKHIPRAKKEPFEHQIKAIKDILSAFDKHNRATNLMACGTGKTLVALWVAERMKCKKVLVLVPSLALLRQTLHEWFNETHWDEAVYLCVCSDPTVAKKLDEVIIRQSDLDFPVTTESETVREFLNKQFNGVKIVFSTYQSAQVVAEGMSMAIPFELGIFDEAHKTAGREGAKFTLALKDENIAIKKRLFMTATPRHYNLRKRDEEGDHKIVYSMDIPELYGPVAHSLSFAEAARSDIICNYKVIISVVTSEMVNAELLRRGEVIVNGDPVEAHYVANQIALQKAVAKYQVNKIITFHKKVATAKRFASHGGEGIKNHLPDFEAFHVNGTVPTANRENLMKAFKTTKNGLITNARCLTEGVDIPVVDMVAFISPKRSTVDIVQATGRALRKSETKTKSKKFGFILVPLFVEQTKGESIKEAIERAEFEEVWMVLQAMKEQDDLLVDIIDKMREEKVTKSNVGDTLFREKVKILGPELSADILRDSIAIACAETLGSIWDEKFAELKKFHELFGSTDIPEDWIKYKTLRRWVAYQRSLWKKGKLSENRIRKLNDIGFTWEPLEASWEEMYLSLIEFKNACGHCNVPIRWEENQKLANWVIYLRKLKKKGQLREDRIKRLDNIGFIWDWYETKWDELYSALVEFKKVQGHCYVPRRWEKNKKLANWVIYLRTLRTKGQLRKDHIKLLDDIGFIWAKGSKKISLWDEMILELREFKKIHGHCKVPEEWPKNPELSQWVTQQQILIMQGKLSEKQIAILEEIGFHPKENITWEKMYYKLIDFKAKYGHCNVPLDYSENLELSNWVKSQRNLEIKGGLKSYQIRRLNEVEFVWRADEFTWEQMFEVLVEFKNNHGHCNVPHNYSRNLDLAIWIRRQRDLRRKGKLNERYIQILDMIGLKWSDPKDDIWEKMFSALVDFKTQHGHCNVPKSYSKYPELGKWVRQQRKLKEQTELGLLQFQRLDEIGLRWEING